MLFPGKYTDGKTAVEHEIYARLEAENLVLYRTSTNIEIARWPLPRVEGDTLSEGVLHLRSRDCEGALVAIHDDGSGALELLRKACCAPSVGLTRRRLLPILGYGSLIALLLVGYYTAAPFLARQIAVRIPYSWEEKFASEFTAKFLDKRCQTPESRQALEKLVKLLVAHGQPEEIPFKLIIIKNQVVNAYALPGGVIVLNSGFLRATESPDEIAGVVAHEMEHVKKRHVLAGVVRSSLLTGIWTVAMGDYSGLMVIDPSTAYQIATLKFNRADEAEADRGAVKRLVDAGISTVGFAAFFARAEKQYGATLPEIFSTHPSGGTRQQLASLAGTKGERYPLTGIEWAALRTACF